MYTQLSAEESFRCAVDRQRYEESSQNPQTHSCCMTDATSNAQVHTNNNNSLLSLLLLYILQPPVLRWHDHRSPPRPPECLYSFAVTVRSYSRANCHEESKCRRRARHVLSQRSHDAVRARTESDDVCRAEDEAYDQAHTASHHCAHLDCAGVSMRRALKV